MKIAQKDTHTSQQKFQSQHKKLHRVKIQQKTRTLQKHLQHKNNLDKFCDSPKGIRKKTVWLHTGNTNTGITGIGSR